MKRITIISIISTCLSLCALAHGDDSIPKLVIIYGIPPIGDAYTTHLALMNPKLVEGNPFVKNQDLRFALALAIATGAAALDQNLVKYGRSPWGVRIVYW